MQIITIIIIFFLLQENLGMSVAAPHHEGGEQIMDSNQTVHDLERINDEELLKNLVSFAILRSVIIHLPDQL